MYNITFIHNSHTNNKIVQSVAYSQSKWERGRGREREKEKQRTSDDFLCCCESHNFPYFYSFTATLSCICSFISIQLTQLTKLKSNSNFFIILFSSVHIHTFLCSLVPCIFSLHVYCSQLNIIRIFFFFLFFGERIRIHIETEMKIWNKVWISLFRLSLNNSSNNITQFISISTHECIRWGLFYERVSNISNVISFCEMLLLQKLPNSHPLSSHALKSRKILMKSYKNRFFFSSRIRNSNSITKYSFSFWVGVCLWLYTSYHSTYICFSLSFRLYKGGASKRIKRDFRFFPFVCLSNWHIKNVF